MRVNSPHTKLLGSGIQISYFHLVSYCFNSNSIFIERVFCIYLQMYLFSFSWLCLCDNDFISRAQGILKLNKIYHLHIF